MKSLILTVLASMVLAGTALATPGGEGNNQGCNGNGNPNSPCGTTNEGGAGGSSTVDIDIRNTNTAVADADARATAVQGQEQGQIQGQFQAQGNSQKLTIEDAANPASSAAALYLANCSSGASAQGFGGGGSVGGPDEVCLLLNASNVAFLQGDVEQATELRGIAVKILKERTNSLLRFLQMLPVVRRVI